MDNKNGTYQPNNRPPYGQPPYGQSPYGQAPYGQPPYGQAPYGQPPYGRPPFGPPYYQPPVTPPKPHQTATGRDLGFAAVMAMLCVFVMDMLFWGGTGLGAAVAMGLLLFTGVCYLAKHKKRFSLYGTFCLLAYLAGAAALACTDSGEKVLILLLMPVLAAVAVLEFMDLRAYRNGDFRSIGDVTYSMFALTFGTIGNTCYALFHKKTEAGEPQNRKTGAAFLGLIIAVPVLLIIVPLLMSSDAAFSGMMEQLGPENLIELIGAVFLGLCLFLLAFGRLLAAQKAQRQQAGQRSDGGVEPAAVFAFLTAVAVVYVLYLVSQLSYFFSAFAGFLPKDFSVAEYARRGFFEMTLICTLNLLLVFLTNLVCRKKEGKAPLGVRLLCLFLCLFSLVLAATSLSKIVLYVNSFGMTWLRLHTSVFVIFLCVVFLAVMVRLFWKKVPYMKIAMVTGTLLLLATTFANVDKVIARYNVEGYLSGKYETVDMETIRDLNSDAVVPALLRLVDDEDPEVAQEAQRQLTIRALQLFTFKDQQISGTKGDTRSWNAATAEAQTLLEENFERYFFPELLTVRD